MAKIAAYTADDSNGSRVTIRETSVFGANARKMVVDQAQVYSMTRGNIWVTARDANDIALHTFGMASSGKFIRSRVEFAA